MAFVTAGHETTANLLGNAIVALLTRPGQLDRVLSGDVPWTDVIEESLRSQPLQGLFLPLARHNFKALHDRTPLLKQRAANAPRRKTNRKPSEIALNSGSTACALGNSFPGGLRRRTYFRLGVMS